MEPIISHQQQTKTGFNLLRHPTGMVGLLLLLLLIGAGCQSPMIDSPKADKIILREGDVVVVHFPSSTNLDTVQAIRRDGKISLPLVGDVYAVDVTPDELQDKLIKLFEPQISSKEITVTVQSSTYPVYVTGSVQRPGKIEADQPLTAIEAVMEAGGFDYAKANMKNVRIIRHEKGKNQSFVLDLKDVIEGKNVKQFYLRPNDIVYVPEKFTWF